MRPQGPSGEERAEETTDWPATPKPAPPTGDAEATQAAPVTPSAPVSPAAPTTPPGFHEETTLEAAQFVRPGQQHPASQPFAPPPGPPHQAPVWPAGGAYPGQQAPPAGYPPHPQAAAANYPPPGVGGPPAPPQYPQPPITPTARPGLAQNLARHRWWLIGGAAALVAIVVIAIVVAGGDDDSASTTATSAAQVPAGPTTTVRATPNPSASRTAAPPPPPAAPPPPAGPVLPPDALPGLLLPVDQVSQRLNTPGMTGSPVVRSLLPATTTPPNCTGAWGPAYQITYEGSGHTGSAIQLVSLPPGTQVAQAVVAFPDPAAARGFFDRQVAEWNACKSTHIVYSYDGGTTEADLGVPSVSGDMMTMMLIPTTAKTAGQQCERDMTVRGNVVIDVRACSPTVGSAGFTITRDIADKVR